METSITFTFDFYIFTEKEYDVDNITKVLNINPTRKWIKGEFIKDNLFRKDSCWSIVSEEKSTNTFEESFIDFFNQIHLVFPTLINLIREDDLNVQIDTLVKIYNGNTMPGIHLSSDIIKILSELKCSIDFDIYDFRVS